MHMVGHDHIRAQCYVVKMIRDGAPTIVGDMAQFVQQHFTIHDFAEQTFPLMGHNRDEIRAGLGIIVSGQARRFAVVLGWIKFWFLA